MSLKPEVIDPVPEETARVAKAVFPKGNVSMQMREEYARITADPMYVEDVLKDGADRARPIATKTLNDAKTAMVLS